MKIKRVILAFFALCFVCYGGALAKVDKKSFSAEESTLLSTGGFNAQEDLPASYGLKRIGSDSRTSSFNELLVRRAKRLCNTDSYETFMTDGRDFVEFWSMANEVNLELEKVYTCFRLFFNHYKWCETIDYTVADHVFRVMPQLFDRHFEELNDGKGEFTIFQDKVENLMLKRFIDDFDGFHAKPDVFLANLSTDLTSLAKSRFALIQQENEEYEYKEKLRNLIIRFSDLVISRMYWKESDYERIWRSFTGIASHLHTMGMRGIINEQDHLDELWDTLVKRFVWYLDFRGSALPVEFYEQIEEDLKDHVVFFLEIDELDEGIKSKKEILAQAVVKAKAKALAYESQGMITDQMNT